MQKNNFYFLLLFSLPFRVMPQVLSMQNVFDTITHNNPTIQMYESNIQSMKDNAQGARSWMTPQVGAGQFFTPYNTELWKRNGEMLGLGSVMFSLEQMFPNKKKLDAEQSYMNSMSVAETERKEYIINDIIQEAKAYYYNWLVTKKKIALLKESEQNLHLIIHTFEIRYRNGTEKIGAYYKAMASLGEIKNTLIDAENTITNIRIRMNTLMDRNPEKLFDIDTIYELNDYSTLFIDKQMLSETKSDIKAIEKEKTTLFLKQESEKENLKPQFGIRYDHMIGFGGQPMQYTLMGMVRLPMVPWASKMTKASIKSLECKIQAIEYEKQSMLNEYINNLYRLKNNLAAKIKQISIYETQVIPALQNNYKTIQRAYAQNTEELFILYDAWQSLNQKELEYINLLEEALSLQVFIETIIQKK